MHSAMKRHLRLFHLILCSCLLGGVLFGQDGSKVYSVKFSGYKIKLSKKAKASLNDVAKVMKDQPNYNCVVTGYCISENVRFNATRWDRINKIINHLVEKKGIDADRFIFRYGTDGDNCDKVDLGFTSEKADTPSLPHPNLR